MNPVDYLRDGPSFWQRHIVKAFRLRSRSHATTHDGKHDANRIRIGMSQKSFVTRARSRWQTTAFGEA